jgi:hypothetical protein
MRLCPIWVVFRHGMRSFTRPCPFGTDFRHGLAGETHLMSHAKAHMARQQYKSAEDIFRKYFTVKYLWKTRSRISYAFFAIC